VFPNARFLSSNEDICQKTKIFAKLYFITREVDNTVVTTLHSGRMHICPKQQETNSNSFLFLFIYFIYVFAADSLSILQGQSSKTRTQKWLAIAHHRAGVS